MAKKPTTNNDKRKCGHCNSENLVIITMPGYKKYRCVACWHEGMVR